MLISDLSYYFIISITSNNRKISSHCIIFFWSYHSCNFSHVWDLQVRGSYSGSDLLFPFFLFLSFFFSPERIQNPLVLFIYLRVNLDLFCNRRHSQTLCFFEITNSSGSWRHQLHLAALQRCVLSQDSICLVMSYCLNSIWGKLLSAKK